MHIIHTIPQVLWAYSTTWQRPPVCLDDQERERTRERECVYPRRHVGLTSTVVSTGSRGDLECGSVQQQNSQSIQPRTQRNRGTSPLDPPTQPHKSRVKFNSQCRSLVEISTKLRSKFGRNFDQTSIEVWSKFACKLRPPIIKSCYPSTRIAFLCCYKLRPAGSKFGRNFDPAGRSLVEISTKLRLYSGWRNQNFHEISTDCNRNSVNQQHIGCQVLYSSRPGTRQTATVRGCIVYLEIECSALCAMCTSSVIP